MNPLAAKELLDLIMLDDFVERKQALDAWGRRWLSQLQVHADLFGHPGKALATAILHDVVHAVGHGKDQNGRAVLFVHLILQEPFGPDAHAGDGTVSIGESKP